MEKFEKFVKEYDYSRVEKLPKFMKKRLDALKKIQLEHINLLHQYHKEIQELELKYETLYKPLYDKRYKIVSGEYEPTDEECQLPVQVNNNVKEEGNQENLEDDITFTPEEEADLESKVKGMPGFWLGCLSSSYNFTDSIEPHDRNVLKHLKDIRINYGKADEFLTYTLEFVFDENPYFTNKVLTKTYYLKLNPDEKDPFSYEGFEVVKSEGCEIDWNPGKDTTTKVVTVKQANKKDGRTRDKQKEVERDSFFYFFKPPVAPANSDEIDEELGALMAVDFELGEIIRQSVIPKASLFYSGHLVDDDDDDLDDEDEDEDEEDSEGEYDSDLEESDDSRDSLNKDVKDN